MENTLIIIVLSFLLVSTPFLSKLFRLPVTVVEIMAGMLIGGFSFMHENTLFSVVAEVGFLYLMFLAGLEVDLKDMAKIPKAIIKKAYVYHVLIYVFAAIFVLFSSLSYFFILALPLISIGIIVTLTKEYDKEKTKWLDLSLNLGVMGELISIVALTFAAGIMKFGVSLQFAWIMVSLLATLVATFVIFSFFRVLFWWFPEIKMWLMPYSDNKEQDLRLSFAFFFIIIAIMMYLDLELVLGAFVAGIIINSFFEHKEDLPEKLSSFGFGFLVPLFFIHIGTTIDLRVLTSDGLWGVVFLFIGLTILTRLLSALVFIKEMGLRGIFLFAISQSMPLTLVIAAATVAFDAKSIDGFHYSALVVASVIGVIINSLILKLLNIKSSSKNHVKQHKKDKRKQA